MEKFVDPLIKKIRKDSEHKNAVKPISEAKQTIIKINKQLESGFVGDEAKKVAMTAVRTGELKLASIQKQGKIPDAIKEKAEALSEKMKSLLEEVAETPPSIDGALEGTTFSKKEKELIRKVLNAVYELYDKTGNRDELNRRVLEKLKRNNQ